MTLSKSGRQRRPRHQRPSGGSEAYEEKQPEDSAAATPYKGSRCCIGFFQCQVGKKGEIASPGFLREFCARTCVIGPRTISKAYDPVYHAV